MKFHFVFLISLRNVKKGISLPELVKAHHGLEDVPAEHVESILMGKTGHKVLIIAVCLESYVICQNLDILFGPQCVSSCNKRMTSQITKFPEKYVEFCQGILKRVKSPQSEKLT